MHFTYLGLSVFNVHIALMLTGRVSALLVAEFGSAPVIPAFDGVITAEVV